MMRPNEQQIAKVLVREIDSQDRASLKLSNANAAEGPRTFPAARETKVAKESFYTPGLRPSDTPTVSAARRHVGRERRIYPRRDCRIEAYLKIDGDLSPGTVKIADISLGGCYLEMLSPLPLDTQIDLTLKLNDATSYAQGKVRSSQSGMGMGIEFTEMSRKDFESLRKFVPPALNAPEPAFMVTEPGHAALSAEAPQPLPGKDPAPVNRTSSPPAGPNGSDPLLKPSQTPPPTMAEALEAVVRVLFRRGIITRAEISEELEKLKSSKK